MIFITAALCSCSKPPELFEIEDRLEWLLNESADVNELVFGEGLPTYERVYDPLDTLKYYEDTEKDARYYYYTFTDGEMNILAYRMRSYGTDFKYLEIVDESEVCEVETSVYHDEKNHVHYIPLPDYEEKKADFYYNSSFPENYDVVILDETATIDELKKRVSNVYSKDYCESLYGTLFEGAVVSTESERGFLTARFMEFSDDNGTIWLMESNTYKPLISEKRIYDTSTASVARGSNAEYMRINIESYLESKPDEKLVVTVCLIKENGEWYLDSPTY